MGQGSDGGGGVPVKARVGWIGLGRIGAPMAERVRAAGWPLVLWARRPEAAAPWRPRGRVESAGEAEAAESAVSAESAKSAESAESAEWAGSAEALAAASDIVCTAVSGPADVQGLHARLMPVARPGTSFIDFSTASPATAAHALALARPRALAVLEAPVTGGVAGAAQGTLTCFVGGDDAALEKARPLLGALARRIVACGPAGSGYRTKLINQTLVAGVLMGLADGARIARAAGIEAAALGAALEGGTASGFLLKSYLQRMVDGGGAVSFTLALLLKDLMLAREEAASLGLAAPLVDAAIAATRGAIDRHGAAAGVQALAS